MSEERLLWSGLTAIKLMLNDFTRVGLQVKSVLSDRYSLKHHKSRHIHTAALKSNMLNNKWASVIRCDLRCDEWLMVFEQLSHQMKMFSSNLLTRPKRLRKMRCCLAQDHVSSGQSFEIDTTLIIVVIISLTRRNVTFVSWNKWGVTSLNKPWREALI